MQGSNPAADALIVALKAPNLTTETRASLLAALQAVLGLPLPIAPQRKARQAAPVRRADAMRLTREAIAGLALPTAGERLVYDFEVPALAVRLRPGGRTFIVVAWDSTRRKKVARTIGKVGAVTPEQARVKAKNLVAEVANGNDIRRERTEGLTNAQLVAQWHAEKSKSLRTADEMRDKALDHLGRLAGQIATETTREQIGAIHHAVATKGQRRVLRGSGGSAKLAPVGKVGTPATADKWLAIMSSVFNWAAGKGLVATNPCRGIAKAFGAKESARSSYLHGEPLLRFWAALQADPDADVRDLLLVALYTGQRKGNVASMRWDDVDLTAGLWTIGASSTKQKRAQTNPLSAPAREILARRWADGGDGWVFPATRGGGAMSATRPRAAWARICKAAELTDVRIHDLRHTAGSWLARLGSNEAIRQKALGHQTAAMAARYAHLELDPVADAMERMGAAVIAAATREPAPVRKIRGAK